MHAGEPLSLRLGPILFEVRLTLPYSMFVTADKVPQNNYIMEWVYGKELCNRTKKINQNIYFKTKENLQVQTMKVTYEANTASIWRGLYNRSLLPPIRKTQEDKQAHPKDIWKQHCTHLYLQSYSGSRPASHCFTTAANDNWKGDFPIDILQFAMDVKTKKPH